MHPQTTDPESETRHFGQCGLFGNSQTLQKLNNYTPIIYMPKSIPSEITTNIHMDLHGDSSLWIPGILGFQNSYPFGTSPTHFGM